MNARLLFAASVSAFFLAACGGSVPRPDGGIAVCEPEQERFLVVTVLDAAGEPAPGATVQAQNVSSGARVTAVTNDRGVSSAIGTSLGSGTIVVSAQLDNKTSQTSKQAEFNCGECGCTIEPDSLTLQLNP